MDLKWLEQLAHAGTAIGTGIVLWTQFGRPWLRRPRLALVFDPDRPGSRVITNITLNSDRQDYKAAFVRLDVIAELGRDTAEDVEVLVAGARRLGDGDGAELPLQGSALAWANVGLRTVEGEAEPRPIPPGVTRRVDAAHVWMVRPDKLQVDVRPEPTGEPNVVDAGVLELDLVLVARNVKPSRWRAQVSYDSDFAGEEFPQSLNLRLERLGHA